MSDSSSEEKSEEASSHKLQEARKKGQVAQSAELNGAAGFVAVGLTLWAMSDSMSLKIERVFASAVDLAQSKKFDTEMPLALHQMFTDLIWICLPLLLAGAIASVLMGLVQTRGVLAADPVMIQFERMNPGEAIKRLFSTRQIFELLKLLLKLSLLVGIIGIVLKTHLAPLVYAVHGSHDEAYVVGFHGLGLMVLWAGLALLVLGFADYAHQRFEFLKEQRMGKTEVKREQKQLNGDPELQAALRSERRRLLSDAGKGGMGKAQVLITNPTHFAVALYYEPGVVDLPVVVAKGSDSSALQMRTEAKGLAIPILENPPLARSLFAGVAQGDPIGAEHLEAVAEVFRWLNQFKAGASSNVS